MHTCLDARHHSQLAAGQPCLHHALLVRSRPTLELLLLLLPACACRWATFIGLGILMITTPVTSIFMKKASTLLAALAWFGLLRM